MIDAAGQAQAGGGGGGVDVDGLDWARGPGRAGGFAQVLAGAVGRLSIEGGAMGAGRPSSLSQLDPAIIVALVNSLDPAALRERPDLNALVTRLEQVAAAQGAAVRPDLAKAVTRLISVGALAELPGEPADLRLRRAHEARLRGQLSQVGLSADVRGWSIESRPEWRPVVSAAFARRGPEGRGFDTVEAAMLGGAGWAAREQNRPTQPFGVEAEHAYLTMKGPDGRFSNYFVRGNWEAAVSARVDMAQQAPAAAVRKAVDDYRLQAFVGDRLIQLLDKGLEVAATCHTHPRDTGIRPDPEGTNALPSGADYRGHLNDIAEFPGVRHAIVFHDATTRLTMSFYSAEQAGQHLDVSVHRVQTVLQV